MVNPTQLMSDLIEAANQKMKEGFLFKGERLVLDNGFARATVSGYEFKVRVEIINTNSKVNQHRKVWWINDKRSSAQKVHDVLKSL